MLPLRHLRFWRITGLMLLLLALAAALMPADWFWDEGDDVFSWFDHSDKLLHAMTFLTLSVWFSGQYRPPAYLRVGLALLLFGLLIEFCQFMVGYRTADWRDMVANTVGVIVGFSVAIAGLGGWSQRLEDWYAARSPDAGVG